MPNSLTNANPDYYRSVEVDNETVSPYHTRTMIYSTLDSFAVSQVPPVDFEDFEPAPHDTNLTIQAFDLVLAGKIVIPGGNIRIYCKKLSIAGDVMIDVSGILDDTLLPPFVIPPALLGEGGKSGAQIAQEKNLMLYGTKGEKGGSITILCQEIIWGSHSSLNLISKGGKGYPGCNGQQGGDATDTLPAGRGGDAQSGGEGGDGGMISIQYSKTSELNHLKMIVIAGEVGDAGTPGGGGGISSSGNHKKGLDGNAATPALTGEDGDAGSDLLVDIGDIGRACDEAFLLKLVQRAKLIYLQNQPEMYKEGDSPSEAWKKDWIALLELLVWIQDALTPYKSTNDSTSLSELRKNNLYNIISQYVSYHHQTLDYFSRPYNEVPTMVIDEKDITVDKIVAKYLPQYDALIEQHKSLSENFQKMIADYDAQKKQNILDSAYLAQLTFAQSRYQQSYKQMLEALNAQSDDSLSHQIEIAISHAKACQYTVMNLLKDVDLTVKRYQDFNIKNILEALTSFAFTGGEGMAGAATGAIAGYQIYEQIINNMTDKDGHTIEKNQFIKEMTTFQKSVTISDMREPLFTEKNGQLVLNDNGKYILTGIDQFENLIEEFSNILGEDLSKTASEALENYKAAIYTKGQLQLRSTSYLNQAALDYEQYVKITEQITELNNKDNPITPYKALLVAHCAMLYQEQMEQVIEFVATLRREYAYLTMKINGQESGSNEARVIPALWGPKPGSGVSTNLNDLRSAISQIIVDLGKYYATRQSPTVDIPAPGPTPQTTERGALFSFSITDKSIIDTLIATNPKDKTAGHQLTIRIIPEGTMQQYQKRGQPKTAAPRDKRGNLLFVAPETHSHFNIRVTKVQPRVYGATGTRAHSSNPAGIEIGITADTNKGIVDAGGDMFIFSHALPRSTIFIHRIDTIDPDTLDLSKKVDRDKVAYNDDILQNNGGDLTDDYLDAQGLFGCWTISIKPGETNDVNDGLDLSSVYKITFYFAVKAQGKANLAKASQSIH